MNKYDKAKLLAVQGDESAWEAGRLLMEALDTDPSVSIRRFTTEVYGPKNVHKEDTVGRWVKANRFKRLTDNMGETDFLKGLEMTYWAEAWTGYEDGWDIEYLLDTLENAKEHTVQWFRDKRAEATGKTAPLWKKLQSLSKLAGKLLYQWDKLYPDIQGLTDSFDEESAYYALVLESQEISGALTIQDYADLLAERMRLGEENPKTES